MRMSDSHSQIDRWWEATSLAQFLAHPSGSKSGLEIDALTSAWDDLDLWGEALATATADPSQYDSTPQRDDWNELPSWWQTYIDIGHQTAIEIAAVLEDSNEAWKQSPGTFDTDPLAANLTRTQFERGPLQPGNEVNWSRWLAQLLTPSAALVRELFDVPVDHPPTEVRREDRLKKSEGGFRRPDILVYQADRGISIEVKLDDENFGKTAETATLVEEHYSRFDWTHTILLPERQQNRLATIVEPPVITTEDESSQVQWEEPGPVTVLHWRDVTAALRSLLRRGESVDAHWAANAYLFCAVAEQQLLHFKPAPVIRQLADPSTVVDTIQPIGMAETLEEQLTYLRMRLEA